MPLMENEVNLDWVLNLCQWSCGWCDLAPSNSSQHFYSIMVNPKESSVLVNITTSSATLSSCKSLSTCLYLIVYPCWFLLFLISELVDTYWKVHYSYPDLVLLNMMALSGTLNLHSPMTFESLQYFEIDIFPRDHYNTWFINLDYVDVKWLPLEQFEPEEPKILLASLLKEPYPVLLLWCLRQ